MTITVELPPEIEERLLAQARARGLSVDAFVRDCLARSTEEAMLQAPLSASEMDKLFEEAADMVPNDVPPLSDGAMSRESIYSRGKSEDPGGYPTFCFAALADDRASRRFLRDGTERYRVLGGMHKACRK